MINKKEQKAQRGSLKRQRFISGKSEGELGRWENINPTLDLAVQVRAESNNLLSGTSSVQRKLVEGPSIQGRYFNSNKYLLSIYTCQFTLAFLELQTNPHRKHKGERMDWMRKKGRKSRE
jgi:hypothetical protein